MYTAEHFSVFVNGKYITYTHFSMYMVYPIYKNLYFLRKFHALSSQISTCCNNNNFQCNFEYVLITIKITNTAKTNLYRIITKYWKPSGHSISFP